MYKTFFKLISLEKRVYVNGEWAERITGVEVCDARNDDSSTTSGTKKTKLELKTFLATSSGHTTSGTLIDTKSSNRGLFYRQKKQPLFFGRKPY